MNNRNWVSTLSKKHKSMVGLFNNAQFIGVPPFSRTSTHPNNMGIKIVFVEFGTVLLLSANIGQCHIKNSHFSRYLIGGGNVL